MDRTNRLFVLVLVIFSVVFYFYLDELKKVENGDSQRITSVFLRKRGAKIINLLPKVASEQRHALYFGTSELEGFFETELVDKELAKKGLHIRSYNLGMRSAPIPLIKTLVKRLVEAYENNEIAKADYVVFKLPLARMTVTAEKNFEESSFAPVMAAWSSPQMIFDYFKQDPLFAFQILVDKYVFSGNSRTSAIQPIKKFFRSNDSLERDYANDYFSLWRDRVFFDPVYWNEIRQGLYGWRLPLSQKHFERAVLAKKSDVVRLWGYEFFNSCCDLLGLDFSETSLSDIDEILKDLKKITDHVFILHIQEEPSYAKLRSAEQELKIDQILQRYSDRATIIDFRKKVPLSDSDYIDFQHLNKVGFGKLVPGLSSAIYEGLQK